MLTPEQTAVLNAPAEWAAPPAIDGARAIAAFQGPYGEWDQTKIAAAAVQLEPQKAVVDVSGVDEGAAGILRQVCELFPQANALSQRAQAAQLLLRLLAAKVASNQPFGPDLVDQLAPHALAYAGSLLTTLAAAAAETPQDEPLSPSVLATKAVRSWFT